MSHECEECGEEFDTERGLSVHKTQSHSEEDSGKTTTEKREDTVQEISLNVRQFGGLVFGLGLFLGIIIGGTFSGGSLDVAAPQLEVTGDTGSPIPSDSPAQNTGKTKDTDTGKGDSGNTGSQVVSLNSGDYPYNGLKAGIGEGNVTLNGKTFRLKGEPYIGSADAPVTAVSFEDFECPFCSRYNQDAFPKIRENYVAPGKVQYFFKNLPLPQLHPWAKKAALASECALNQDVKAFWTFKKGFFSNQKALGQAYGSGNFDKSMYKWAEQTGLNVDKFKQCYDNKEEMDEVEEDAQQAGSVGAQATPTVFIDGKKVEGAQPYSRFKTVINNALQQ
ncbi:MAG: DsbA family protein [Candidatus Nanohalobium sp.]